MRSTTSCILLLASICAASAGAAPLNFDTLPADGVVVASAVPATGWGYTLQNTTPNWILPLGLSSTGVAFGTLADIFSYPVVAPGQTLTQPYVFNPPGGFGNSLGLFEYVGNPPVGTVQTGSFELLYQFYGDNPDVNPEAQPIGGVETASASFEIRTAAVPEPGTAALMLTGGGVLAGLGLLWMRRSQPY